MQKKNVVIFPPCGENVGLPTKRGANKENLFLPLLPRLTAVLPPQGREMFLGFTLIELLVVVLIIDILAAVAVPQYKRAVEKSRATEALVLAKHLAEAEELYYLEHGTYTSSYSELGVKQPVSKYFYYVLDPSVYNILVLGSKRPYEIRYFMQRAGFSSVKGRFLCITRLDNALGTAVCRSLARNKTGFAYPYNPTSQAYYIN